MGTSVQEERKKKADEKKARMSYSWIIKRLCWETIMSEQQINKDFGNDIFELIKNGEGCEAICRRIKVLINRSIGQREGA